MDAVYPATASALARGRRLRRAEPRHRHRTMPVTFAEIKEVDEESSEERCGSAGLAECGAAGSARRRPDVMEEALGAQFVEFRRRRARHHLLRERDHKSPPPAPVRDLRAGSEPGAGPQGQQATNT